ncbi:MAG: YhfC family glutamic-type intramembrane protease [Clostridium sp.]
MNQIVFSAGFVQANIFCSLLCILLPILFVWYQKRKNGVKPGAFFIGAAFCLLFSYVAATIVNVLIFSIPGLLSFFSSKTHPIYSALFGAFSLGILSTIGAFVGLKYAMKKRPGKENALIFGVGMGGFESILNGATVYITNIIAALLINSIGSTEYFKKTGIKRRGTGSDPEVIYRTGSNAFFFLFLWMLLT